MPLKPSLPAVSGAGFAIKLWNVILPSLWLLDARLSVFTLRAGEDAETIRPTLSYLADNGIGGILDYAAESDVSAEVHDHSQKLGPVSYTGHMLFCTLRSATVQRAAAIGASTGCMTPNPRRLTLCFAARPDRQTHTQDGAASRQQERELIVARTFDYEGEAACDGHMRTFLKCIQAAAASDGQGFAAIKVCVPPAVAALYYFQMQQLMVTIPPRQPVCLLGRCTSFCCICLCSLSRYRVWSHPCKHRERAPQRQ